ncbi:MAG: hypothetical protein DSY34_01885 [Desulfurobacterium sp.]|nr:MAG: hypothetical protein DSY34_01885 [Desulfurobacterium sp.]
MHKTAIYVDFDNIYGAVLDKLGVSTDSKQVSALQIAFLKEVLKKFFKTLKEGLEIPDTFYKYNPLCLKVFAEYENLPLSERFSPGMAIFLHNVGVTPVNPFVAYSKRKENKNAADLALTLTAIEDLLVKKIPAERVIICTCDIDLYPLILWLKEHTGKEILLAGFPDRTNKLYDNVLVGERIDLDWYFMVSLSEVLKEVKQIKEWTSKQKVRALTNRDVNFIIKLVEKVGRLYERNEFMKLLENFISEQDLITVCEKFKRKLISGLKSWLKTHDSASTGLIVNSWLPRWNLGIDILQANECLKQVIVSKELEEENISFELEKEEKGLISGRFFKTNLER